MLDAIHTNGCCVPQYLFELFNNQLETNPRQNIARLINNNSNNNDNNNNNHKHTNNNINNNSL